MSAPCAETATGLCIAALCTYTYRRVASRRVEEPSLQDFSIALVTVPASRQRQSSVTNASGLS
jgi:hypothetical protein